MHLHIYVISIFRDYQTHGFKINTKNNENLLKPKTTKPKTILSLLPVLWSSTDEFIHPKP